MTRPLLNTAHLTVFSRLGLPASTHLGLLVTGFCATLLAGCATTECPPCKEAAKPAAAVQIIKPLKLAAWADLPGWSDDKSLVEAFPAQLQSCSALGKKAGWQDACNAAKALNDSQRKDPAALRTYYQKHYKPYQLVQNDGADNGLFTGYYEPLLQGAKEPTGKARYPVYGTPPDLLTIELGDLFPELKGKRVRGRLGDGNKVIPYWTREQIESNPSRMHAKTLAWVDDAIELFFLQVQGSGRVQMPDGSRLRIGYADQNGQPYQSIGSVLIKQGALTKDTASMQGIQNWARSNPSQVQTLLNANPSYVFFRVLPTDPNNPDAGPPGALGVPLTPGRSIAIDPRATPLGAPVWLDTSYPNSNKPLQRLVLAQDTGGAIKGAVRADFFWGFGAEAGKEAGRMKQSGRMWTLLPPAAVPADKVRD